MKQLVRLFFLAIVFIGSLTEATAQSSGTAIGEWRLYPPHRSARSVTNAGDRIYCITETGFFYLDKQFNSLHNFSKIDGLHDSGISTVKYDSVTATLLIAYQNTNLDLVRGQEIININDILRKTISGEKTINHIYFANKLAYLSCSFGLVVLDLVKLEIRDTYVFLGPAGTNLKVWSATTLNDQIFISTSNGIMSALNLRTVNLSDLKNWKTHTAADGIDPVIKKEQIRSIATFNNLVYAGVDDYGAIKYDGTSWSHAVSNSGWVNQLNLGRNKLIINSRYNIILLDAAGNPEWLSDVATGLLTDPLETAQDRDGIFWTATFANGLLRHDGTNYERIIPNGPADVSGFKVFADENSVLVMGGGYSPAKQNDSEIGFYEFKNGTWENYNYARYNDPAKYPMVRDLVDVTRNPVNGKLYLASFGFGLIEWNGVGDFFIHNMSNSPLKTAAAGNPNFVQLTSIAPDQNGTIWVVNPTGFAGQPGLYSLQPDNTWKTHSLQNTSTGNFGSSHIFHKVIVDDNGYKWISLNPRFGSGVVVYDDVNNRFRLFNRNPTTGNLPGNTVTALAKDNKGEIWVGTETGIGVFFDPEFAFASQKSLLASTPAIGNRALLEGQRVNVIAVDGANRKWVGTENGAWLFNETGDQVIYNFTMQNSPLPSGRITDIAVNHATGDVFFSTEGGLASFRAGATVTTEKPDCANVFPNPVRPGYSGDIAITGISNNASIKITDITGALVFQTKALGGTALWNGRDNNGKRVRTGVYLVLSSNAEGAETCISKVAVIE